jgi:hypothetical protein
LASGAGWGRLVQVTVNGKVVGRLEVKLERRLVPKRAADAADGVVWGEDEAVAQGGRGLKILYSGAAGFGALIMVAAIAAAASYEPRDLAVVVPLAVVAAAATAWLLRFVYRRNVAKIRARAQAQLPHMPAPGTVIRIEPEALSVGGHRQAWTALSIESVDITDTRFNDEDLSYIERLRLAGEGRPVVLDLMLMQNARRVLDAAWLRLRAAGAIAPPQAG